MIREAITPLNSAEELHAYRNYPVVGEGPFNVIIAFCLELHVIHTSRLQTNPGCHFSKKEARHMQPDLSVL